MYSLGMVDEINPRIENLNSVAEVFVHIREYCLLEMADLRDGRHPDAEFTYTIMPNDFNLDNPKLLDTKNFFVTVIFFRVDDITNEEIPVWANVHIIITEPERI